jgi:endonuclease III
VDTHARRVAARLGWTSGRDAASAERTRVRLESFIPRSEWNDASLALVGFGQIRCAPRNPRCDGCPVGARCPEFRKKEEDENDDGNGKGLIKGEVPRDVEDLW